MKTRIFLMAVAYVFLSVSPCCALVIGDSNLDYFSGYPDPTCTKPYKPYQLDDDFAVQSYNSQEDEYVRCINKYVDNAKNDIARIKEKANAAVDKANSPY